MTISSAQEGLAALSEGIAILINLAERGEIDPWDVQVIEVIDRCLSKLTAVGDSPSRNDFTDLSQSGQAFLYASMLVLLKAESLLLSAEPPAATGEGEEPELLDPETTAGRQIYHLERQLRRRGVAQLPRKRPVSLPELIEQLQLMRAAMAEAIAPARPRRTSSKVRAQAARAIAELAHQENLVETASELERFLAERSPELNGGWLDIEQLLEVWPRAQLSAVHTEYPASTEPSSPTKDLVGVFWALLLLSAQSKVELAQEEFYQDLKLRPI